MGTVASTSRNERIDALKFFAIALVVLGHVANLPRYHDALGEVVYVIRTINMPLFMFLSGYVLFGREGHSPMRFVQRKSMALMVPYFAWIAFDLLRGDDALSVCIKSLGGALIDPHVSGRKWFLYVLFVCYALFTLLRMVSRRDIFLVIAAALTVWLTFLPDGDYLGRLNLQWLFTFFVAGYLIAKHRSRLPVVSWGWAGLAAAVFVILLAIGWLPDHGSGWPPWFIAVGMRVFATSGTLALSAFLLWKYSTAFAGIACVSALYFLVDTRWWRWQSAVGRRSLGIYVTQGWLLVLAFGGGVLGAVGSWILVTYVALAVAMLLEKTKWTRVLCLGLPAGPKRAG